MATRPVSLTTFATLTGPITEPVSVLDTNLANLQMAVNNPLISSNIATDVGGVNTFSATINPGPSVLDSTQQGLTVKIKPANTNTGAATFNLNGFGANSITLATGNTLVGGEIVAGQSASLVWSGSGGKWILENPATVGWTANLAGEAVFSTPPAGFATLAALATDAFGVTKSAPYFLSETGYRVEFGGGASKIASGVAVDTNSYISSTGTAGTINTNMVVKSITLKAGSLNAVGRGIAVIVSATQNTNIAMGLTITLNAVTLLQLQSVGGSGGAFTAILFVEYIDSTHTNSSGFGFSGAGGTNSATPQFSVANNTAGFTNTVDQTLAVTQSVGAGTAITVFKIQVLQLG